MGLIGVAVVGPVVLAMYRVGANNYLESECPVAAEKHEWVYDRSSWWPGAWSCIATTAGGELRTVSVPG